MKKYNVIIVDDSAFMRILISDIIESDDNFNVIAKFKNGKELIDNIERYNPDVITLDIEMSEMDGIETLKELKNRGNKYPILMLSSLTQKGSMQTMKCLELGAYDFVEKTSGFRDENMKRELINKLKGIVLEKTRKSINTKIEKSKTTRISNINKQIDAVVIGASTGGPKALQEVLTKIDSNIGVPIFVVQHMPKGFTKAFAERLNKICKVKVVEAENNMKIEKNTIYIAQGGYHMTVGDGIKIKLNEEPAIWGVRPAVDKLFESAIKVYGEKLLSVVLTGMGRDGASGSALIKDYGGVTIAESESTCVIYGMPKAAAETGKIDLVLPLYEVGDKINRIVERR